MIENHNEWNFHKEQWELKVNRCKQRQARENASDRPTFGLTSHLIGWKDGASFFSTNYELI